MKQFATSLLVVALLTQDASSISLNEASSVWAEIEEGAMHKHKEHHHHHKEKKDEAEQKKESLV